MLFSKKCLFIETNPFNKTNFQNNCFFLNHPCSSERKERTNIKTSDTTIRQGHIVCMTTHRIIPVGNDAVLCCLDFFGVVNHFVQYFSWFCIFNKLMLQNQIKKMSNSLVPVTYHKRYLWDK